MLWKFRIKKIYRIKKRPFNNPIISHFKNLEQIKKHVEVNNIALKLAELFWPGPLTLILKKRIKSNISPYVSNHMNLIGCRIPKHSLAIEILKTLNDNSQVCIISLSEGIIYEGIKITCQNCIH